MSHVIERTFIFNAAGFPRQNNYRPFIESNGKRRRYDRKFTDFNIKQQHVDGCQSVFYSNR